MKKAIARRDDGELLPSYFLGKWTNQSGAPIAASDSDDSITQRTNRGNKLKRKAKYVQEGKLNNPNGSQAYTRVGRHLGNARNAVLK